MRFHIKTILVIFISVFMLTAFTNTDSTYNFEVKKGIDFYNGDYQEALEKAKAEKKLVFVYLYANWCGVCKSLKKNTFRDASVGEFYNKEFINLSLNAEKAEGAEIARSIGLRSYPTLLYVDANNGRILNRVSGYKTAIQFINLGKIFTQKQ